MSTEDPGSGDGSAEGRTDAQDGGHDPVGSWGEEAARLFASVAGWAEGFEEHVATGAKECTWCPVCRTVHAVRTVSPEVRTHLTAAAVSLARAAAALLAAAPQAAHGPSHERPPADERVQRIRLDDDPDPA